jgi:hypothetical protein
VVDILSDKFISICNINNWNTSRQQHWKQRYWTLFICR